MRTAFGSLKPYIVCQAFYYLFCFHTSNNLPLQESPQQKKCERVNPCSAKKGVFASPSVQILVSSVYTKNVWEILLHAIKSTTMRNVESDNQVLNSLTFVLLRTFLQWQVVTGMEAEQIIGSLTNCTQLLRAPNAVCISHLLLTDRTTPVDLCRHKIALLVTFC